ncbi:MAG: ABC transporter ATP-binding protein [Betaproteobacteria bacterium]|nr:ABC transporter ATP-binding protein [Betaproteobacteria bacterium]
MSVLEIRGLHKAYGGIQALDDADFVIESPGLYGLIGPNGAGKTTLFDVVAGTVQADSGSVRFGGQDITGWPSHRRALGGISRSFQECRVLPEESCLDNVLFAAQPKGLAACMWQAFTRNNAHRRRVTDEAMRLLGLVRLQGHAHTPAAQLSFGQKRLLELVSVFMSSPRLLLLDEPASGVNPALLEVLSDFICTMYAEEARAFLIVEHNMEFIMALASDIIVMHQGKVLERGSPQAVQASPRVLEAYLG